MTTRSCKALMEVAPAKVLACNRETGHSGPHRAKGWTWVTAAQLKRLFGRAK